MKKIFFITNTYRYLIFFLIMQLSNLVIAENSYITNTDIFIKTLKEHKNDLKKQGRSSCLPVPDNFKYKLDGSHPDKFISNEEVIQLIGSKYKSFGVGGMGSIYSILDKKLVAWNKVLSMKEIQSKDYDDYPIICGNPNQLKKTNTVKENNHSKEIPKRQLGIVYKSKHFWQNFINFDAMINTFNGKFDGVERKKIFKVYYRSFLGQYEKNCKSFLSGSTVGRRFVMERAVTQDNSELYREVTTDVTTRMESRFADKYDEYKDIVHRYYTFKGFGLVLQQSFEIKEIPDFQIKKFFDQVSCNSATMYQMKENLWRVSHGRVSLQADGIKIRNAENESVSIKESAIQKNLYEACIANGDDEFSYRHERYCRCFNDKALTIMTKDELTHYSKDFDSYYDEVVIPISNLNKGDFLWDKLWRLYKPHSSGHRCQ